MTTRGSQSGRGARTSTPAPRRSALRERLDPYGGLTTILVVLFAVVFLGAIAWQSRPRSTSTADLKGQVSLVNVFASWCAPCRVEHPNLKKLSVFDTAVTDAGRQDLYRLLGMEP